ncbi:MAG: hypothetical protein KDA41_08505, partial [Planctomycetales bacterium]|nr:hypothetical protein [Planctomycetales bacterium]
MTRNLRFAVLLAAALFAVALPSVALAQAGFTVRAFQLTGGGGANDADMSSGTEPQGIWNAIDDGASLPLVTVGASIYNVFKYETGAAPLINYGGTTGNFGSDVAYSTIGGGTITGGDQFSVRALALVTFQPGTYSIAAASDDGRRLTLYGLESHGNFTATSGQLDGGGVGQNFLQFNGLTGHNNTRGTFTLATAQTFLLDSFFYERGGGDSFEVSVVSGNAGCCTGFSLLQDGALGGNVTVEQYHHKFLTADGNWADPNAWTINGQPIASEDAYIGGGHVGTVTAAGAVANDVYVGHSFTAVDPGAGTLNVDSGGVLNADTLNVGDGTFSGVVSVNGTGSLNVATLINLDAGTLNFNAAGATLATNVQVESGSTGVINFAGGSNTISGQLDKDGANLTVTTTGSINYSGAIVGASANSDMTFGGGGTHNLNTANS